MGIVSNKEDILNNSAERDNSKEEGREPEGVISDIVSNENSVSKEVVATDDDEIDSAKLLSSTVSVPATTITTITTTTTTDFK